MSAYVELSDLTKIYDSPKGPAIIVKISTSRSRRASS